MFLLYICEFREGHRLTMTWTKSDTITQCFPLIFRRIYHDVPVKYICTKMGKTEENSGQQLLFKDTIDAGMTLNGNVHKIITNS